MNKSSRLLRSRSSQPLITFAFIVVPLLAGLALTPAQAHSNNKPQVSPHAIGVESVGAVERVDIIDGEVDVDENGVIDANDTLDSVLLAFNDAALVLVDIITGQVDANQDGAITGFDDVLNADLTQRGPNNIRVSNQVDIINGLIDVNEDGAIDGNAANIFLIRGNFNVDTVDIINREVDVDENGAINGNDTLDLVVLAFNDAALVRMRMINGHVDANQDEAITGFDDVLNADLTQRGPNNTRVSNQVDIINGLIDVNEDGAIDGADDAANVFLIRLMTIPNQVDIVGGQVDLNENGVIDASDTLDSVLLAFNDAALINMGILNGFIDVNKGGGVNDFEFDVLANVDLTQRGANNTRVSNQVDIIDGLIDVNEDGAIDGADTLADVLIFS